MVNDPSQASSVLPPSSSKLSTSGMKQKRNILSLKKMDLCKRLTKGISKVALMKDFDVIYISISIFPLSYIYKYVKYSKILKNFNL